MQFAKIAIKNNNNNNRFKSYLICCKFIWSWNAYLSQEDTDILYVVFLFCFVVCFLPAATFHSQLEYMEYHKWLCSAYRWRGRSLHVDPAGSLGCSILILVSETVSNSRIKTALWIM